MDQMDHSVDKAYGSDIQAAVLRNPDITYELFR